MALTLALALLLALTPIPKPNPNPSQVHYGETIQLLHAKSGKLLKLNLNPDPNPMPNPTPTPTPTPTPNPTRTPGKFLKLVPKYRAQAIGCYQVVIDARGSEDSWLSLRPQFKYQIEGAAVVNHDRP